MNNIQFDAEQFNRVFPFFLTINENLEITATGRSLEKLFPGTKHTSFFANYTIKRPHFDITSFDVLRSSVNQVIIMECANRDKTILRGQLEYIGAKAEVLFLGSPWFSSIEQVIENDLVLNDFAYHDPMIDLLHVLKTQDITNEDLKYLLTKINFQKKEIEYNANRLSSLITNLHAGVLLEDENRNISLINKRFCEFFEMPAEPSDLIGIDCTSAASQSKHLFKEPDNFVGRIEEILQNKKLVIGDILELCSGKYLERDFIPIWKDTDYTGHLWIYTEITERINAEKELKIAKKVTEELARAKQSFLANMSHEIRTPMNAIIGMTRQLTKTTLTQTQRFYLNTINGAADNLLIIINDILDLSKIEAGKLSIEKIGFVLKEVIDRSIEVMRHKAEEKGLQLSNAYYNDTIAPVLIGDPYRINQVLLNIISNAIKFTDRGGVSISCEVEEDDAIEQVLSITITDTGIGMDEEFIKHLFQKFSQEDESITRRFGGTGLGMNICKELVELMGGALIVKSKKDIGTSLIIKIRFNKGTADSLPLKEVLEFNEHILSEKKILLTDDNEMNRLVASVILKNLGAEVTEAQNGKDAIQKMNAQDFDIVLMDVQMPVMDGITATKIIRDTISRDIPIIALTAFAIKGDEQKFLDAGMNGYISKPFDELHFIKVVCRWLGNENILLPTEPKKEKKAALYDLSQLESISKGDKNFIKKMVELFIREGEKSIHEITEAYNLQNIAKVKSIAHKMKPSIENMGIMCVSEELRVLENAELSLENYEELGLHVQRLEKVMCSVILELKSNHLNTITLN